MKFEVLPILSIMEELYQQPISTERFKAYLAKLQGKTKKDLVLPIAGFNPMAKEHVLQKVRELQQLEAEQLMQEVVDQLNATATTEHQGTTIKIALNVADDLKGGWTNRYTTDFDSKFKINSLVDRDFCTPYFWSSEHYTSALIKRRTLAYAYRTLYWKQHSKLITLQDHLDQEIFVHSNLPTTNRLKDASPFQNIKAFYDSNKQSETYTLLFNFFYGDAASKSLNYPVYGIKKANGFEFAQLIGKNIRQSVTKHTH